MLVWLLMLLVVIPIGLPLLLIWGSIRLLPRMQRLVERQRGSSEPTKTRSEVEGG